MSVRVAGKVIHLVGHAQVGDAETVLAALHEEPGRVVDLSQASHIHSAIVQLLLALRPSVAGLPAYPFYSARVAPLLDRKQG